MSNVPHVPRTTGSPLVTRFVPPNLHLTEEQDSASVPLSPLVNGRTANFTPRSLIPRPYQARAQSMCQSSIPLSPLAKTCRRYQSIASPPKTQLRHRERRSAVSLETRFAQLDYSTSPNIEADPVKADDVKGLSGILSTSVSSPVPRQRRQNRRAVVIGITYSGTKGVNELPSCADHMPAFYDLLTMKFGFPKESIWLLSDGLSCIAGAIRLTPTRANIINAIKWLVLSARRGDKLIFAFCGHGVQVRDESPKSSRRVLQCILPSDYPVGSPITGTELRGLLAGSLNIGANMTLIFDCQFADRMMCLPYLYSVKRGHKGKLFVGEAMDDNEKISLYSRSSPISAIMRHSRQQKEYTQLKKQLMEEQRDELAASLFDKGTVVCLTNGSRSSTHVFSLSSPAQEYGSLSSAFVSVMHDSYSQNSSVTLAELLKDMSTLLSKKRGAVLPRLGLSHKLNIQSKAVAL